MKRLLLLTCILFVSVGPLALAQNLVGQWSFEGNLLDTSGNNNNGTATGTIAYAPGRFGQALDLTAGAGYVRIPNSPSLQTPNFTVAYWAYLPYAQDPVIAIKCNPGFSGCAWQVNLSSFDDVNMNLQSCLYTVPSCNYSQVLTPSPVGNWTHVAETYDGTTLNGYVNGNLVLTWTVSTSLGNEAGDIFLGAAPGNGGYQFYGLLDEVQIYDGALTAAQVYQLANPVPTDKNQCKNGGWLFLERPNSTLFANQGLCIQYVNTGR